MAAGASEEASDEKARDGDDGRPTPEETHRDDSDMTQTHSTGPPLSEVWPIVYARTVAYLGHLGLDRPTAEDIAQEVGIKVLLHDVQYRSAADLFRWCRPVGRNLALNWLRHEAFMAEETVPDRLAPDVADHVEPRLALEAVRAAFDRLSEEDRAAIRVGLSDVGRGDTKRARDRIALRILRARRRLRRLGGLIVLPGIPGWRLRADRVQAAVTAATVGAAAVGLTGVALTRERAYGVRETKEILAASGASLPLTNTWAAPAGTSAPATAGVVVHRASADRSGDEARRRVADVPWPAGHARVDVHAPVTDDRVAGAGTSNNGPADPMFCWGNLPLVVDGCVEQPIRDSPIRRDT